MRRADGIHELLDGPLAVETLAGNLRDLARINRWLGGTALSWHALSRVLATLPSDRPMRLLDVGTGGADIPLALVERAEREGRRMAVEATDVRAEVVAFARQRVAGKPGISVSLVAPDQHDWPDGAFDVVHASLVLHHHDMPAALQQLAEFARLAAAAVIINDLHRGRVWWMAAWLLTRIGTRNRYTRHDGPMSVRRAWTADEVAAMARRAGLREEHRFRDRLGHRYALVLVHDR